VAGNQKSRAEEVSCCFPSPACNVEIPHRNKRLRIVWVKVKSTTKKLVDSIQGLACGIVLFKRKLKQRNGCKTANELISQSMTKRVPGIHHMISTCFSNFVCIIIYIGTR
jgi:hypothetical protein